MKKILQLCCFSNHWPEDCIVESWDIINGKNVMELVPGKMNYDLILAAPPCTQFTKASSWMWEIYPKKDIDLVNHIIEICEKSKCLWVIENPPGRIEQLVPGLKKYRVCTLNNIDSNKEWILYSNLLIMSNYLMRYGRACESNKTKRQKLEYNKYFIDVLYKLI